MADPLSGESKSARYSQSRTDTLIGAGVRVAGNVTFTGVLRIQGDIQGDVSCDVDANGTLVVGQSGNVTGTIKAPHIVVSGRVVGPAHSSESIEIHQGACFVGDTFYKTIQIHAGGIIEGSLIQKISMERDRQNQENYHQSAEPSAAKVHDKSAEQAVPAAGGFWRNFGVGYKLAAAVILVLAVIGVMRANRETTPDLPQSADVALKAESSTEQPPLAQSEPVGGGEPQTGAKTVSGEAISLQPSPAQDAMSAVQSTSSTLPEMAPENIVMVHGVNPGKPAGLFAVISQEPSVLFRKKLQDPADGERIDITKGASISIAIGKNEIFRVAKGREITIFYQGRKVAPSVIESGAWMRFVPQSPTGENDAK